jgi:methanogenic corrinoid protein MtbC1
VVREVGERWHRGSLSVAQEHMVTDIVRRLIANASRSFFISDTAPSLVLTTLSGERHELGIMMCHWLAASRRCRTHYLGPDTPVEDIVSFATSVEADAVLVSMVMPENEVPALTQLRLLSGLMQPRSQIWIGGRASQQLTESQVPLGTVLLPTLADFENRLELLMVQ